VETDAVLQRNTQITLALSTDDAQLRTDGIVVWIDVGAGVAVQFVSTGRMDREHPKRIMQFVEHHANYDDQSSLAQSANA